MNTVFTTFISITHVCKYFYNKYVTACICSRIFLRMYVLACMLCLIWGCDALVLRRREDLVAPSWTQSCLTMEECCRGHRASAFLLDAPHASHAHTKSYKHLQRCQKKHKQRPSCSRLVCMHFTESLRVWRECKHRGSISVDCIYCCDNRVSWRPLAFLKRPGVLRLSFVKEPRGPRRG